MLLSKLAHLVGVFIGISIIAAILAFAITMAATYIAINYFLEEVDEYISSVLEV